MIWTVKISSKGQITLPKGVREYLGLQEGDRVVLRVKDDRVFLEPIAGDILQWYGALENAPAADEQTVREAVRRAIAEEVVREGQGD